MAFGHTGLLGKPVRDAALPSNHGLKMRCGEKASPACKVVHDITIAPSATLSNYSCYMDTKSVRSRTFGKWLQRKIDARQWNGADLARAIVRAGGRATPGDVSRWLRGEREPQPHTLEYIADAVNATHQEAMEAAGHAQRLPMDAIERFHRITHPYAKDIDWEDDENVIEIRYALDHIIRIQERRSGKRSLEQWHDPVEANDDDE